MANSDIHGWYLLCLQCGYMKDLDDSPTADTVILPVILQGPLHTESTKEAA